MVDIKAADARLSAAIQQRMAKGGQVDIEAADARLSAAMNGMAGGGVVDLHPRVHEILNAPPIRMKAGGTVQHFDGGGGATFQQAHDEPSLENIRGQDTIKATPRHKIYGTASDALKRVHEFATKPVGDIHNPVTEILSEFVGIPAASRVLDDRKSVV